MSTHSFPVNTSVASAATASFTAPMAERVSECRSAVCEALASEELTAVEMHLDALIDRREQQSLLGPVNDGLESRARIIRLSEQLAGSGIARERAGLERLLFLRHGLALLDALPSLRLPPTMIVEACKELQFIARPDDKQLDLFRAELPNYPGLAYFVRQERFPAGQLHIKRSGIPRSWLIKPTAREKLKLYGFMLRNARALRPYFFIHMTWRRRLVMSEREHYRSYYRIAQTLELQPEVRGLTGASWFHSPDTFTVSPHLAWMNRIIEENGGFVTIIGPAHPTGGVFQNDVHRKKLWEEGKFQPTTGMVLWPRAALLEWARTHPEYAT